MSQIVETEIVGTVKILKVDVQEFLMYSLISYSLH